MEEVVGSIPTRSTNILHNLVFRRPAPAASSKLNLVDCFCRVHNRIDQPVPIWLAQGLLEALLGRLPIWQSSFILSCSGLGKSQAQRPTIGSGIRTQPSPVAKESERAGESCAVRTKKFGQFLLRDPRRQLEGLEQRELGCRDAGQPQRSFVELRNQTSCPPQICTGARQPGKSRHMFMSPFS